MSETAIHPIAFALGFLTHSIDLMVQHPAHQRTPFDRMARLTDLLLHTWGLTLQEIEPARQLLAEMAESNAEAAEWNEYKRAALEFARSTPERARLWMAHCAAVACFQNLHLEQQMELPFPQQLYLYHIGQMLGLDEAARQQAIGVGVSLALTGFTLLLA